MYSVYMVAEYPCPHSDEYNVLYCFSEKVNAIEECYKLNEELAKNSPAFYDVLEVELK